MLNYSVLMSVYAGENSEFFKSSIESMLAQTVPTDDFILVCDGPLTPALDKVIAEFEELKVMRLPQNQGLAEALNIGLRHCKYELVARMDSDDISLPHRIEQQLKLNKDIVGSAIQEFISKPGDASTLRSLPTDQTNILRFAKRRNPFNHPSVLYRKSAVLKAGGYENYPLCEDYQLWVKMLMAGNSAANIPEPLVYMRVGSGLYKRRGGISYFKIMLKFRRWMYGIGFSGPIDFCYCLLVHAVSCFAPDSLRRFIYTKLLRVVISQDKPS